MAYILVAIGAAAGGAARYGIGQWTTARWGTHFPWGTLTVNVTGSLIIGVLAVILARGDSNLRVLLITGLLGGYTTFSSFSLDALELLQAQRWGAAVAYAGGSVLAGLVACGLGYALGLWLTR